MRRYILVTLLSLGLLAACVINASGVSERSMATASSDLLRLSYAVQGEIMRGAAPGSDLVGLACERDPSLCSPLSDYRITVKREGEDAVLLLCTADQRRALLEDIACTPRMDAIHWEKGNVPCQFTLRAAGACP